MLQVYLNTEALSLALPFTPAADQQDIEIETLDVRII